MAESEGFDPAVQFHDKNSRTLYLSLRPKATDSQGFISKPQHVLDDPISPSVRGLRIAIARSKFSLDLVSEGQDRRFDFAVEQEQGLKTPL